MSDEKRQQSPEGYYNPGAGAMPGSSMPQMPQMPQMSQAPGMAGGYGYPQAPFPQMPSGSAIPPQGQQPAGFPGQMQQPPMQQGTDVPGMLPVEESYIENILRLNKGKLATVYMTFENNDRWNAKVFKGIIEAAGRDHIILSDPETNRRYLLLMVYLDYVTFDEELNYEYPFAAGAGQLASYPPR